MTEEGDVGVGDVVETDAALSAIADAVLGEKILFIKIPAGAIGRGMLARSSAEKNCYTH
jgi:hypothetical protein